MPYGDAVEPVMAMLSSSDLAVLESLYALSETEGQRRVGDSRAQIFNCLHPYHYQKHKQTVPTCSLSFVTSCLPWLYDIPSFVMNT